VFSLASYAIGWFVLKLPTTSIAQIQQLPILDNQGTRLNFGFTMRSLNFKNVKNRIVYLIINGKPDTLLIQNLNDVTDIMPELV
jgi:hypothetical protein